MGLSVVPQSLKKILQSIESIESIEIKEADIESLDYMTPP